MIVFSLILLVALLYWLWEDHERARIEVKRGIETLDFTGWRNG